MGFVEGVWGVWRGFEGWCGCDIREVYYGLLMW